MICTLIYFQLFVPLLNNISFPYSIRIDTLWWTLIWTSFYLEKFMILLFWNYFSEEEIKGSVFSLPGEKSPGPNGFPLCFYQHFWDDIKRDIFEMFDHFYNSDDINTLRSVNQTFIALIPKKTTTEKIQDYRPISLLNSSYRLFPSA